MMNQIKMNFKCWISKIWNDIILNSYVWLVSVSIFLIEGVISEWFILILFIIIKEFMKQGSELEFDDYF